MRVFVLCTGRCGSTTFVKACRHATNFTAGHESRWKCADRLAYPDDHIEADNRLSWMLGSLGKRFPDAVYVHLTRNRDDVIRSFAERSEFGIMRAFAGQIATVPLGFSAESTAALYVDIVEANISAFLQTVFCRDDHDERLIHEISIDDPIDAFRRFWSAIGAVGDLDAALAEFQVRYNAS